MSGTSSNFVEEEQMTYGPIVEEDVEAVRRYRDPEYVEGPHCDEGAVDQDLDEGSIERYMDEITAQYDLEPIEYETDDLNVRWAYRAPGNEQYIGYCTGELEIRVPLREDDTFEPRGSPEKEYGLVAVENRLEKNGEPLIIDTDPGTWCMDAVSGSGM